MGIEFVPSDYRAGYYWHAMFGWMKDFRLLPDRRCDRAENKAYRNRRKIVRRESDRSLENFLGQQP